MKQVPKAIRIKFTVYFLFWLTGTLLLLNELGTGAGVVSAVVLGLLIRRFVQETRNTAHIYSKGE